MPPLSPDQVEQLGRALSAIESMAPALAEMMVPSPPASGVNGGRPPSTRESRPPLPVYLLDVEHAAELCLWDWAQALAYEVQCRPPTSRRLEHVARWLHDRVHDVAERSWADGVLVEVEHHRRVIGDRVSPPEPVARREIPQQGSARQVADALAVLGVRVSHTSLRKWAKQGEIPTTLNAEGVELFDITDCMRAVAAHQCGDDTRSTG
ncbi:hypothetical protein HMPREF2708_10570 [Corynebacterium sp. HMSC073H12]|uniref:hypothetical protein n=1 Tax=Corynebacterium sp. HMSC073H12 TaxID=1715187 RepID=UPI0008A92D54|nr:hypothetical protein [Corynebacterium sp. HMSC073H12]OHQ78525.1 hypothetical protein HMPREF2708_10570 [Corynebacterium sp. HMSC073H12]